MTHKEREREKRPSEIYYAYIFLYHSQRWSKKGTSIAECNKKEEVVEKHVHLYLKRTWHIQREKGCPLKSIVCILI